MKNVLVMAIGLSILLSGCVSIDTARRYGELRYLEGKLEVSGKYWDVVDRCKEFEPKPKIIFTPNDNTFPYRGEW